MTAKDSSGANINTGGEVIYVEISNSCTKGVNFAWVPDSGTKISTRAQMADNSDGTYTYNYQVPMPGTITVAVLLYTQGGVYNEFFPNTNESGNNEDRGTWPTINLQYGVQNVYLTRKEDLSVNFYFRFKSPTTGPLTFTVSVDDTMSMYIGKLILK